MLDTTRHQTHGTHFQFSFQNRVGPQQLASPSGFKELSQNMGDPKVCRFWKSGAPNKSEDSIYQGENLGHGIDIYKKS